MNQGSKILTKKQQQTNKNVVVRESSDNYPKMYRSLTESWKK